MAECNTGINDWNFIRPRPMGEVHDLFNCRVISRIHHEHIVLHVDNEQRYSVHAYSSFTPEFKLAKIRMPGPGLNFYDVLEEKFAGKSGLTIKQSPAIRANEQTQNGSGLTHTGRVAKRLGRHFVNERGSLPGMACRRQRISAVATAYRLAGGGLAHFKCCRDRRAHVTALALLR